MALGHETTAHSLGFALARLSVHQDHQQKLFDELRKMVPLGGSPVCSLDAPDNPPYNISFRPMPISSDGRLD
jgi:cytochrome P450